MEKKPRTFSVTVFVKPLPPHVGNKWYKGVVIANEKKEVEKAAQNFILESLKAMAPQVKFQITVKDIICHDDFVLNLTKPKP
jgi:hypothetical protein